MEQIKETVNSKISSIHSHCCVYYSIVQLQLLAYVLTVIKFYSMIKVLHGATLQIID